MTTDTPEFSGANICVEQSRLEAAKAASNLQVPVGENPARAALRLVDSGWNDDSATYHDALEALTHSVPKAAQHKNVPVLPQYHGDVAREAVRMMTNAEMAGLLALQPESVQKAQLAICHALDVVAATMIANFIAYIRGIENAAPWFIAPIVEAHLEAIHKEGTVIIWPDLLETAIKYNNAVPADA